jgi:hypothetical protein
MAGKGVAIPGEPEARYEELVDALVGIPGVTPPRGGGGFGRTALRCERKIFVMWVRGQLVLKLPADRVDELIADGAGVRFDANKGTPMQEWLSLDPDSGLAWLPLAREALDFARSAVRPGDSSDGGAQAAVHRDDGPGDVGPGPGG